jgi:hypothetical protein
MDYYPTTIQSNERPWSHAIAIVLLLLAIVLFPILWPANQLWRYYRLYSRGFWLRRKGRDSIEYHERRRRTIRRLTIGGEMMATGPHVVYVPTDVEWDRTMPTWARGRRDEIIENVRCALGTKRYEFVCD